MDDNQIGEQVADFLERKFLEYREEHGWRVTLSEFSKYLGVNNSTLSTWMRKERLPQGDHNYLLGQKLGPEYYDARGIPRPMPDSPWLRRIVDLAFYGGLTEEDLEKTIIYMENLSGTRAAKVLEPQ